MTSKPIAISGCTFAIDTIAPPGYTVVGTIGTTGSPDQYVKCGGIGVLKDGFGITVSGITATGTPPASIPFPGPVSGTINATAQYCKASGSFVLRTDDEAADMQATPQIPGSPPVNLPVTFRVRIVDAGQDKANAE